MRRLFAITLIALLMGVGVVAIIETDPGYVLVSYGYYTLETSLWVGLFLLFLLVLVVYWTLRLVYRLLGGQRTFMSWLGNRKSQLAQRHSTRGVIHYVEGNLDRARRQLERGLDSNEAPLVNYSPMLQQKNPCKNFLDHRRSASLPIPGKSESSG